jgi:D-glycero-alpha-D-manno-heptose-7-phosphate kinase
MIITRTPFRLPLGGGGTDLPAYYRNHGGYLITSAIDKYMFININRPALVDKIKLNYSRTEIVDTPDQIQHDLVRECLKLTGLGAPIEIHSMADLSGGTGLGSSSTYTVGLLRGLVTITRKFIQMQELAEMACTIEMEKVGKPIGKQDQYAAAFGGIIELTIETDGRVAVRPLNLHDEVIRDFENHLMMFYTNIERNADDVLRDQGSRITRADNAAASGSGMTTNALEAMHKLKDIGHQSKAAIEDGDYITFGKLLHEHWLVKRGISEKMSQPQIDQWYDIAMNSGALGGKIMGAGGGGFFLFCVDEGKRKSLRITLEKAGLRYMDFRFDFEGSKVIANV